MYFQQFYLTCLAHGSYMIGSEGVAALVDSQRDVEVYLEEARQRSLRIEHILETHLHADFVSGHKELAARANGKGDTSSRPSSSPCINFFPCFPTWTLASPSLFIARAATAPRPPRAFFNGPALSR